MEKKYILQWRNPNKNLQGETENDLYYMEVKHHYPFRLLWDYDTLICCTNVNNMDMPDVRKIVKWGEEKWENERNLDNMKLDK